MKCFTDAELKELLKECSLDALRIRKQEPWLLHAEVVNKAASETIARLNKLQSIDGE